MSQVLRLFLIENEEPAANQIRKVLEHAGHQVAHCRTAADALTVLGHTSFDLALFDQNMPDMTGLEFLDALAREGIAVPTLILTVGGDDRLAPRVLQAGAIDYVVRDAEGRFLDELPKRVQSSLARHRLQTTNLVLLSSLESARDGIMITDVQGVISYVNRALEVMTGYTREELIGKNPRILKNDKNPPELYADLWHSILQRDSWQGELTNRRKDGSLVEISLTVSPIMDAQGRLSHFVGIQRDITERKLLERHLLQAQKMQSIGTLAGGIAHEFNNLLAGINGFATLALRESAVQSAIRGYIESIVDLSERAASLTRQLLAFARKPAPARKAVRVHDLLASTAELVTRTLHVDVQIDASMHNEEDLHVEADANQLQQAIMNLTLNARDASTGDMPVIYRLQAVELKSTQTSFPENVPQGKYVRIQIADQGCGMTPDVLSQALDPFFTTKPVGKGTGLGLPMVFGVVHGHQGFLTIDSEPGRGTCVGIYLPRSPAERFQAGTDFESGQILEPETTPGRKILVLDDEKAVREVVQSFLETAGHHVVSVASDSEVLALLENAEPVDLAILDFIPARANSQCLYRRLRELRPQLPIILCTDHALAPKDDQFPKMDVHAVLRKPFRMNELWYAVNEALAQDGSAAQIE
jgi:PAS domain S-box-containing protein